MAKKPMNISTLIDNCASIIEGQLLTRILTLNIDARDLKHTTIIGDELRLRQIFINILGNAVKFTPDGGNIRLSITEKPCNQTKVGCYEVVFEDNGIGMSQDYIEQIFEPFSRATDERVNSIQGTGLGMPISRNIVRMMGGDIKVESTLGEGSRFTVTMYLKLQDDRDVRYDRFVDLDVLVADDDPLSLESCCTMLCDLGMRAQGVESGRSAVREVVLHHEEKRDYFACIIDWKMPDMDGIATTRAIRKEVGDDVPIIIISAYDWSDIEIEARAAGANAFISKPLFRSRLENTFSALLGEEETAGPEAPLEDLDHMDFSAYRVLLVEDNEMNAEIATEILQMTGLKVERAADGTEAVKLVSECEDGYYDLIFMDIQMPKMNGYDATRVIRSMNRGYCGRVPIIAMTANAFAEDVQAAKTVGMNEHIAKPLDLRILVNTLEKWLK
jgi:CheY-like chemotaxis protein